MRSLKTFLASILLASSLSGQPVSVERVLFPLNINPSYPIEGALGSRWITHASVHNRGDHPVQLIGGYNCFLCRTATPILAHRTHTMVPTTSAGGSFLTFHSGDAEDLVFQLRARDITRGEESWGAEIPVVREREFAPRIDLLGVPVQENYRITLRIYALEPTTTLPVRVRWYSQPPEFQTAIVGIAGDWDVLLGETVANIAPQAEAPNAELPAMVRVDGIAPVGYRGSVHIAIEPLDAVSRIWSFATVTSNVTQAFTVVSPQ